MEFEQAYEALWRSYAQGLAMGSGDWLAALFAEDGVILGPGVEPVVGREAIRAHQEEFLGAFEIQLDMQTDETEDLGKRGWGRGTFAMQLTPKSGGETTKHTGKYLNIVQRRDDGTLEIVRHCWNADQPLPRQ